MALEGGIIAGIVICVILFVIVLVLVGYNLRLYQRRKAATAKRLARSTKNLYVDSGWRPKDTLYVNNQDSFKGSGTLNRGYHGSTNSMSSRLTGQSGNPRPRCDESTGSIISRSRDGLAPRAQFEDDHISNGESVDRPDNAAYLYSTVNKPQRPPPYSEQSLNNVSNKSLPPPQSMTRPYATESQNHSDHLRYKPDVGPHGATLLDNELYALPTHHRPEITLHPQQLQAQWGNRIRPMRPINGNCYFNGYESNGRGVLSLEAMSMFPTDVSLTGCGAQYVPDLGLGHLRQDIML